MRTSDFDYHLPEHLIAQTPMEPRDHSRLLVVDTTTGDLSHRHFYDIGHFLQPGDLLVLNNSRVLPARLRGRRSGTGGAVEVLLLHREEEGLWKAMVKPGRRLGPGAAFEIDGVSVDVLEDLGDGTRLIRMSDEGVIRDSGEVPLPPYIHTPLVDGERYQTVYASAEGSAAAPTAGLHFTPELLADLRLKGVLLRSLSTWGSTPSGRSGRSGRTCSGHSPRGGRHLQAGPQPGKHKLHSEYFQLGEQAAREINQAKADGRRIICVGTTSVRLLEQAALLAEEQGSATVAATSGWADLFILPGHRFRLVDSLITNFHLPRSTLLMLVAAFAGRDRAGDAGRETILRVYREAIEGGYRFYSFGDCMMVL